MVVAFVVWRCVDEGKRREGGRKEVVEETRKFSMGWKILADP